MTDKYDVIVVGAGPAGSAAALTAARGGLKVAVFERGDFPGAKNVMGGILYSHNLRELVPDFIEKGAPIERPIVEQRIMLTGDGGDVTVKIRHEDNARPPYNSFSVLRAAFDPWFAEQAEAAGAEIYAGICIEEVLKDERGQVCGVRADEDELYADLVIICDGVNSLLAKSLDLHPELRPDQAALACKEVLKLDASRINERFNLEDGQGMAMEFVGNAIGGMVGQGWLYTNKDSLSIGVGALIADYWEKDQKPYDVIESMKHHPSIAPLIEGAEIDEYSAHLIPEVSYNDLPPHHGDGFLVCGDAAYFVNAIHREGSNMAMTSGRFAGETAIVCKEKGRFDRKFTGLYHLKLKDSFILKDLKKYRKAIKTFELNPRFMRDYPDWIVEAATRFFTVDGKSKHEHEKKLKESVLYKSGGLFQLARDAYTVSRALGVR